MAIELRQQLKLTQQLIMTPQLQMAIKLLQLSRLELMDKIGHIQLADNPGRHEPGTGEINFTNVFKAIDETGSAATEVVIDPKVVLAVSRELSRGCCHVKSRRYVSQILRNSCLGTATIISKI